jgi:hypothetical protein
MATGETRYQRIQRLVGEGKCGLLPLDFTCPSPRRDGPPHPHVDHPGKVGSLTCQECAHRAGLYFDTRVCTHPQARQVAARWLADAIRHWKQQQGQTAPAKPEPAAPAPGIQAPLAASSPDPPRREGPTQLSMY